MNEILELYIDILNTIRYEVECYDVRDTHLKIIFDELCLDLNIPNFQIDDANIDGFRKLRQFILNSDLLSSDKLKLIEKIHNLN